MVDTRDLKSLGHNGCAGSSPARGTRRLHLQERLIRERPARGTLLARVTGLKDFLMMICWGRVFKSCSFYKKNPLFMQIKHKNRGEVSVVRIKMTTFAGYLRHY